MTTSAAEESAPGPANFAANFAATAPSAAQVGAPGSWGFLPHQATAFGGHGGGQKTPPPKASCVRCASNLAAALLQPSAVVPGGPRALLEAMGATCIVNVDERGGLAEAVVSVPPRAALPEAVVPAEADAAARARATTPAQAPAQADAHDPPATGTGGGRWRRVPGAGGPAAPAGDGPTTLLASLRRRLSAGSAAAAIAAAASSSAPPAPTVAATSAIAPLHHPPLDQPISVSISCQPCKATGPEAGARAFVRGPNPLSIVLCSNRLSTMAEVQEVLVHELTHVHDVRHRGLDLRDCHQLAYSEVRAAREAECRGSLTRFTEDMCVRSRAGVATSNMFPGGGGDCVGRVMQAAMADRSPYSGGGGLPDFRRWKGNNCDAGSMGGGSGDGNGDGDSNGNGASTRGGGAIFGRSYASSYKSSTSSPR
jgi:hypothetical protein